MSGAPDPAEFLEVMGPAVRAAAAIACALEGRVRNRPKVDEPTAVKQALTIADTASQEAILVPLLEHFPQVSLRAEEDTATVLRFPDGADAQVVIDPIDGTLHSYLGAEGPYAVMVGLASGSRYEASLVALPREDLFFTARRGAGAHLVQGGSKPCPVTACGDGERVLVAHGMPDAVCDRLREDGFLPQFACGGAVSVAPLVPGVRGGIRFAPIPGGVSIRGRIGALIAREAGALVRTPGGAEFPDDLGTPAPVLMVACCEDDLARFERALAHAGLAG